MKRQIITFVTAFIFLIAALVQVVAPALAQSGIVFTADRQVINSGECVNVFWDVRNVNQVYYNGAPVTGENQTRTECPGQTITYYLEVLQNNGTVATVPLPIYVQGGIPVSVIQFWVDRTQIKKGECVNVSWHVQNVKEVYYRSRPVVGENQNRVECPKKTRTYDLIVIKTDGNPVLSTVTVQVK